RLRLEDQAEQHHVDVELGVGVDGDAEDAEQRAAGRVGVRARLAEHPVDVDVDEAGGVVGALDVPSRPVDGLRDAAEQLGVHWSGPICRVMATISGALAAPARVISGAPWRGVPWLLPPF